ncbi:hypothetical protein S100390_v1c04160 [Spiroplasma sp. NBRC 100390]|uniref:hypothetical protein n=1 Tax=unclassified Spiroplasma TaxID=2637901 RepID=UPI0008929664|nr:MULTISPECIES: hypothetical protein [unclassified Spiroplasma]AOX43759.1 hypothetical protein STU14_v1c04160 [Spiroplasma sp. TU-14]APE13229.1 hypothetical protein S100390_v1c04160 [Spiroplasma sp. NBRC 100390]
MKKVLALLNALVITTVGVGSIVSCQKVNNDNNVQVPITTENLTAFFATNNSFVYKGEFFFKDESLQSEEDTERMTSGVTTTMFRNILNQTLVKKFNIFFTYLQSDYTFRIYNMKEFNGYILNQIYNLKFDLTITSKKNNINFKQENLVLQFTETKQYDEYKWLIEYVNGYINFGKSILWQDFWGFPRFPIEVLAIINSEFPKEIYNQNNNIKVLNLISKYCTEIFSDNDLSSQWFYREKRIEVITNSYEYLGQLPETYKDGIRAKVNLTFTYLNNKELFVIKDVELWMPFFHVQL